MVFPQNVSQTEPLLVVRQGVVDTN